MSKFYWLTILLLLHLQYLLVAVGFELAGIPPNSRHGDQQLPHCHEDEGAALLEFRSSLAISQDCVDFLSFDYEYRKLEQWKIGSNCCTWDGIECDVRDGRIIGLDLSHTCLSGSINSTSTLFRLRHLQKLSLAFFDFNHSQIPSAIGIPQQLEQLTSLEFFNVSDNNLSGSIPQGYQFNTFGDASYQGNEGLCGTPLSRDCGNSLEPPAAEVQDEQVSSVYIEWKAVVVGYASAFIVAALIGHHKITVRQNWFVIISRLREQGRGRQRRQR